MRPLNALFRCSVSDSLEPWSESRAWRESKIWEQKAKTGPLFPKKNIYFDKVNEVQMSIMQIVQTLQFNVHDARPQTNEICQHGCKQTGSDTNLRRIKTEDQTLLEG